MPQLNFIMFFNQFFFLFIFSIFFIFFLEDVFIVLVGQSRFKNYFLKKKGVDSLSTKNQNLLLNLSFSKLKK
jgi:hypothetical protein